MDCTSLYDCAMSLYVPHAHWVVQLAVTMNRPFNEESAKPCLPLPFLYPNSFVSFGRSPIISYTILKNMMCIYTYIEKNDWVVYHFL